MVKSNINEYLNGKADSLVVQTSPDIWRRFKNGEILFRFTYPEYSAEYMEEFQSLESVDIFFDNGGICSYTPDYDLIEFGQKEGAIAWFVEEAPLRGIAAAAGIDIWENQDGQAYIGQEAIAKYGTQDDWADITYDDTTCTITVKSEEDY